MCQFEVPTRCSDSDMFNAYERFLWEHCPLTSLVVLCSLYSSLLLHQPKKASFLSGFASPRSGWFRTRVSESLFWSTWVCRLLAQCVLSSPSAALSLRLSVETLLSISLWIPNQRVPHDHHYIVLKSLMRTPCICICPSSESEASISFFLSKSCERSIYQLILTCA